MTDTLTRDVAGFPEPAAPQPQKPARRRHLAVPIALQVIAMIGIGAVLYPAAADWFATLGHNAEISGYTESVERLSDADREALLAAARDYNAHLPQGVLRDPYVTGGSDEVGADDARDSAYRTYETLLRASGGADSTDGADSADGADRTDPIGEVAYPRLGIGLPIYPGTGEDSLSRGAGHLYGSSLPIGGSSTRAVLTSHSGQPNAKLFSGLLQARVGDVFQVSVLGETRTYEVDGIETVAPEATESLRIIEGEDRVTLFTCTPIGINSHRLLVHGVRIDTPSATGRHTIAGDGRTAGFPWWAVGFLAGSGAVAYLLFAPPRRAAGIGRARTSAGTHSDLDPTTPTTTDASA